jgi:NADPH:quinone reductase-like Zn-dependent oxidoreductase
MTALVFAKAAGATTIITSSSDEKLEYVKAKFGADHTINYITHPNWSAEVQRITHGQGADHILEVGGMATIQQSIESVAFGGVVSIIGLLGSLPQDKMPDIFMSTILKGAVVRGVVGGSKQQLEEVVKFIGSRELQIPVDKTFGFNREDIIKALAYVASGKHIGKVSINVE